MEGNRLLDLLYPPKCPFCGKLLERGALLCPECQSTLPWLTGAAAQRRVEFTAGCWSVFRYEGAVRSGIHGYKFGGRQARSGAFGAWMAQCARDHGLEAELITWPSLSEGRLRQRGYDQSELLARSVGRQLGLPVARTLKKARRPAQSELESARERKVNVLGAYTAWRPEQIGDKTLLLVDDIVTTGSTLSECAATLRAAGAKRVLCLTLARA